MKRRALGIEFFSKVLGFFFFFFYLDFFKKSEKILKKKKHLIGFFCFFSFFKKIFEFTKREKKKFIFFTVVTRGKGSRKLKRVHLLLRYVLVPRENLEHHSERLQRKGDVNPKKVAEVKIPLHL